MRGTASDSPLQSEEPENGLQRGASCVEITAAKHAEDGVEQANFHGLQTTGPHRRQREQARRLPLLDHDVSNPRTTAPPGLLVTIATTRQGRDLNCSTDTTHTGRRFTPTRSA